MFSFAEALSDLKTKDYFVWDDFLSQEETCNLIKDYQTIYDAGLFERAGTGNQTHDRQYKESIRTDQTYWLDPLRLTPAQKVFWERLEVLKLRINENLFLGLWSLDGHYSHYPIDGYYHQHLDRFRNDDQRTISMILYFNSEWTPADGGELRFHFPNQIPKFLDVAPSGWSLGLFFECKHTS